jgi:hypothetical protein
MISKAVYFWQLKKRFLTLEPRCECAQRDLHCGLAHAPQLMFFCKWHDAIQIVAVRDVLSKFLESFSMRSRSSSAGKRRRSDDVAQDRKGRPLMFTRNFFSIHCDLIPPRPI